MSGVSPKFKKYFELSNLLPASIWDHLIFWGPTIVETLFPQVQGENVMKKYGTSLVLSWFLDLSFLQKMSLVWNIVDIGTDAYFGTTIREVHTELFYISIVSILCSTASFCTMIYLDMCLFAADSDKLFRRALRLRWGIFVFVPLEGIWKLFWVLTRDLKKLEKISNLK